MSKLSKQTKDKIKEEILYFLYHNNLKIYFTNEIAKEVARDEEFIKQILLKLKKDGLVKEINKSNQGYDYIRRKRWQISQKAYSAYQKLI